MNDLQDAARELCPAIDEALAAVGRTGADHTLVSGSGPTVFGLYPTRARAEAAAAQLGGIAAVPVQPAFGEVRPA
jgi:4-diphosphocytidyl-2-C-methyl-D-erythritol kinase